MDLYQHDTPSAFRFRLIGELDGESATELEYAWLSAASVLKGRELIVDISAVNSADAAGLEVLEKMRASGAEITPAAKLDDAAHCQATGTRVSHGSGSRARGLQVDPLPSQ